MECENCKGVLGPAYFEVHKWYKDQHTQVSNLENSWFFCSVLCVEKGLIKVNKL